MTLQPPYYDFNGDPIDHDEWARLFADISGRHVAATAIDDDVEVSTVWLGLDHNFGPTGPPLIYETMIFGGPHDETTYRYATREAALAGHDQAVALARDPAAQTAS